MNIRFFYHLYSHKIFFWLFLVTFCCQIFFWKKTEALKPRFDLVPPAPNTYLTSTLSLGDNEFLFRILAARLQNSGDVFAGFSSLKDYDYSRIYQWMTALDTLNQKSQYIPSLASYYYSQTQNKPDTKYIIDYLDEHSSRDIDANWWWLWQAIYISTNNLKDLDRALELAYKLSTNNAKNAPIWTKQMPAFIHEKRGDDDCLSFKIIEKLLQDTEDGKVTVKAERLTERLDFMRYFIKNRLKGLKDKNFDPRKCNYLDSVKI